MCATSTEGWCCPGWRRLLETLHLWGWWWWRCGDDWIVLGLVDSWCSALVDDSSCHTLMLMLTTVWSRFFFLFHDSLTHVMWIFDRLLWAKLYSQEALPVWAAEADAEVRPILRQQPQILHHHWEQPSGTGDGDGVHFCSQFANFLILSTSQLFSLYQFQQGFPLRVDAQLIKPIQRLTRWFCCFSVVVVKP